MLKAKKPDEMMLWTETKKDVPLVATIIEAMSFYSDKYEEVPSFVRICPKVWSEDLAVGGLEIIPDKQLYSPFLLLMGKKENGSTK